MKLINKGSIVSRLKLPVSRRGACCHLLFKICVFNKKCFLLFFAISCLSCSTVQLPEIPVNNNLSEYRYFQTQNEYEIAVEPFFEENRLKQYFGKNLLAYGILPIYIIVRNIADQPLLIEKANISLSTIDNKTIVRLPACFAKDPFEKEMATRDILGPLFPIYGIAYGIRANIDSEKIIDNMSRKEIIDKIICQNDLHYGFVYFQFRDIDSIKTIGKLSIGIKNIHNDATSILIFNFNKEVSK